MHTYKYPNVKSPLKGRYIGQLCCVSAFSESQRFIVVVQWLRHVWLFVAPGTAAHQASLSSTISQSLPKFKSIESVVLSNHLTFCCPFLLLPSIFPSIKVFSNELVLRIRWPKYWSFSVISISPSKEHPGLISFRMDWLDLLAVRGTLKRLLQYCSSKPSVVQCSAFFIVQLICRVHHAKCRTEWSTSWDQDCW